jgi:hypothetical protein
VLYLQVIGDARRNPAGDKHPLPYLYRLTLTVPNLRIQRWGDFHCSPSSISIRPYMYCMLIKNKYVCLVQMCMSMKHCRLLACLLAVYQSEPKINKRSCEHIRVFSNQIQNTSCSSHCPYISSCQTIPIDTSPSTAPQFIVHMSIIALQSQSHMTHLVTLQASSQTCLPYPILELTTRPLPS